MPELAVMYFELYFELLAREVWHLRFLDARCITIRR
jgi:hypothetical protein